MTFVSYAQNFEDVMLYRALRHIRRGIYVDVGAQHPTVDSVTKAFSLMGWRGINIEPVQHWFDMLEVDRPHDTNLNVAVGTPGSLPFFEVRGTGLSTTDAGLAARYASEGHEVIEGTVRVVTLDEILSAEGTRQVHFLKVDCEGAEREVLASCSFDAVRPWIVVVEATEPNSEVSTAQKWEDLLTGRGYMRAYDDGLNLYFVAREHDVLLDAFRKPPNVFDDFIRARDKEAHDQRAELQLLANKLNGEADELRSSVTDLSRSLSMTNELYAQWHRRAEADLAAAMARSKVREADHASTQARLDLQINHLQTELSHRSRLIEELLHSTSWRITAPLRAGRSLALRIARKIWRTSRPGVVRMARASRPLVHATLRFPGVRPVAGRIAGPQTFIGRKTRAFLFPEARVTGTDSRFLAMTESAESMEGLLRAAIERKSRG